MKYRGLIIVTFIALLTTIVFATHIPQQQGPPKEGYVPNEKTAIAIATAVWEPMYGEKILADERPYNAHLDTMGYWHVLGTAHVGDHGTLFAEIAKADGKILVVTHGQ